MDAQNTLLILIAISNLFLGVLIYFHKIQKNKINAVFTTLAVNVSAWSLALVFYRAAGSDYYTHLALHVLYTIPLGIPVLFLYFTTILARIDRLKQLLIKYTLVIFSSVFIGLTLFTDLFVVNAEIPDIGEKIISFGKWYFLYALYFIIFFGWGYYILIHKYFVKENKRERNIFLFVFLGTFTSAVSGMTTNLLLPWFGYFDLNWFGNLMTIFFVGFLLYAIVRYRLFNLKVIATEIFSFVIILALLVELFFVTSTTELIFKTGALLLVLVLSYLLIRSVYKEIETRTRIESLAQDLQKANEQLRKLDKQKSEFVSIASHQLRSPLTAIKGYGSMILEGSFGKVPQKLREPIEKMFHSSHQLVNIVEDLLNVTRIEQGRMQYEKREVDLASVVKEVVDELKPNIIHPEKVTVEIEIDRRKQFIVLADEGKIRQVFINLVDNAIKYTPEGKITVSLERTKKSTVLLTVSDNGIGFSGSFHNEMFGKFNRGNNGQKLHANGSGIGLYIAKEITEAHDGKIWAESEGEGKGATFYVELPAA